MYVFIVSVHVVLCVLLVLIILMQPGKGADVSSAFGGGASSQLFGSAGNGTLLTRGTGAIAGLFMVTSVALTLLSETQNTVGGSTKDLVEDVQGQGKAGGGFGNSKPAEATTPPSGSPDGTPEGATEGTEGAGSPPPTEVPVEGAPETAPKDEKTP